jgi:hypothetical protein
MYDKRYTIYSVKQLLNKRKSEECVSWPASCVDDTKKLVT